MNHFDVAVVQMQSSVDKKKNLDDSLNYIQHASQMGADLICFPEFQMAYSSSSQTPEELYNLSERISDGPFIKELCSSAKENKISIITTMYETSPIYPKVFDSSIYIDRNGICKSLYRKLHLYDALGFHESFKLKEGDKLEKPFSSNIGNIGMMICYDIRFPEVSRILTCLGAEILVVPSAWVHGIMKEEHWQIMLRARAIENGVYIIAPDQVGNIFSGRSMIVDPFGTVVMDMGSYEGICLTKLYPERIKKVRQSLPLLKNRRLDVYRCHSDSLLN